MDAMLLYAFAMFGVQHEMWCKSKVGPEFRVHSHWPFAGGSIEQEQLQGSGGPVDVLIYGGFSGEAVEGDVIKVDSQVRKAWLPFVIAHISLLLGTEIAGVVVAAARCACVYVCVTHFGREGPRCFPLK